MQPLQEGGFRGSPLESTMTQLSFRSESSSISKGKRRPSTTKPVRLFQDGPPGESSLTRQINATHTYRHDLINQDHGEYLDHKHKWQMTAPDRQLWAHPERKVPGTIRNVGSNTCLTSMNCNPVSVGTCTGPSSASWIYNKTNQTLALVDSGSSAGCSK